LLHLAKSVASVCFPRLTPALWKLYGKKKTYLHSK
jgi:hypothetical protein